MTDIALDEKTLEAAATAYGVGVNLFQLADAIRSYLRICPLQVAPANPAQVTGSMKRDFAKWLEEQPGAVSMYQAYCAGRITAKAYDRAALQMHDEFATLNFPIGVRP